MNLLNIRRTTVTSALNSSYNAGVRVGKLFQIISKCKTRRDRRHAPVFIGVRVRAQVKTVRANKQDGLFRTNISKRNPDKLLGFLLATQHDRSNWKRIRSIRLSAVYARPCVAHN